VGLPVQYDAMGIFWNSYPKSILGFYIPKYKSPVIAILFVALTSILATLFGKESRWVGGIVNGWRSGIHNLLNPPGLWLVSSANFPFNNSEIRKPLTFSFYSNICNRLISKRHGPILDHCQSLNIRQFRTLLVKAVLPPCLSCDPFPLILTPA